MFKNSTFSRQTVLSLLIISIALINLSFLIIDSSDAFAVIGNDNNKTLNKLERNEGCTPGFWKNHYNELGSSDNQWTSTEFKPTLTQSIPPESSIFLPCQRQSFPDQ